MLNAIHPGPVVDVAVVVLHAPISMAFVGSELTFVHGTISIAEDAGAMPLVLDPLPLVH
eukprot:CAMPEP_0206634436 /NCGR_PEP_ID=MMETSP0325_2-20121206/70043_1 /ASSEMBLY_ACC=CAM_ASM_000347 /TAXON_ID=2866 /ORGANISM="Crypthecodinium cohnii, Strain Seligo" /LENGTH=58 /DNA_ID=CAMNT_0054160237 /DNA_START=676 /DNA_END=852 /DNA_ORIENTATION=+